MKRNESIRDVDIGFHRQTIFFTKSHAYRQIIDVLQYSIQVTELQLKPDSIGLELMI